MEIETNDESVEELVIKIIDQKDKLNDVVDLNNRDKYINFG